MQEQNLSATKFAEAIGVQRSAVSHVLSGRNKASLDFVLKIKQAYPEISLDWILLGKGEKTVTIAKESKVDITEESDNMTASLQSTIHFEKSSETDQLQEKLTEFQGILPEEIVQDEDPPRYGSQESPTIESTKSLRSPGQPKQIILVYTDKTFEILEAK